VDAQLAVNQPPLARQVRTLSLPLDRLVPVRRRGPAIRLAGVAQMARALPLKQRDGGSTPSTRTTTTTMLT
jgi:hypothetical protein